MILCQPSWTPTLWVACLIIGSITVAQAQSDRDKKQDSSRVLKSGAHRTERTYNAPREIDFGMVRLGEKKKKEPKPFEVPDIPAAHQEFSVPDVRRAPTAYFPPVASPNADENPRKNNWILPPRRSRMEDTEFDPLSSDPADQLLRMYEEQEAAQQRAIEGLFSDDSRLQLGQTEDYSQSRDKTDSRYSMYDGNLREASENFLYTEEQIPDGSQAEDEFGYSPATTDSAFDDRDRGLNEPNRVNRLSQEQLDQLSDEELAALASQQISGAEDDQLGLDGEETLAGIQQFTRTEELSQVAGLQQTQAIILGTRPYVDRIDGDVPGGVPAQAATLSDNDRSWRGSLTTLSGVLDSAMPSDGLRASASDALASGNPVLGSPVASHPAMSRIRDQFSFGRGASGTGFTPAGSRGLGSTVGSMAGPASLNLGSSFSSGFYQPTQTGIGSSSLSSPGGSSVVQPRTLDMRNLDILMK